jgi:hypothetical protein
MLAGGCGDTASLSGSGPDEMLIQLMIHLVVRLTSITSVSATVPIAYLSRTDDHNLSSIFTTVIK